MTDLRPGTRLPVHLCREHLARRLVLRGLLFLAVVELLALARTGAEVLVSGGPGS